MNEIVLLVSGWNQLAVFAQRSTAPALHEVVTTSLVALTVADSHKCTSVQCCCSGLKLHLVVDQVLESKVRLNIPKEKQFVSSRQVQRSQIPPSP